ncbi:MAG: hypothetical protein NTW21_14065, partial [Verrucomicrobia bacterium]|nr:hypothetical protein [Verrucomicrobiota bacterium]
MTAIAKRHGITRDAVSKRCVELTELLNLHGEGVTASARPLVRPDGRRESTAHRQPMTSHPRGQSGSAEAVRPYRPPARLALPRPAVF